MPLQLDDLAALDAPTMENTGQPLMLPVASIDEDPEQPRREFEDNRLEDLAETIRSRGVRQPIVPHHCEQACHMYYLLLPSLDARTRLIAHLKAHGILSVFHYLPLHLSPMGVRFGGRAGDLGGQNSRAGLDSSRSDL